MDEADDGVAGLGDQEEILGLQCRRQVSAPVVLASPFQVRFQRGRGRNAA
tara:strand:- start:2726 stop:2875 length:150 start_codon:yes stop_codon:yes gene_type:complete